jgi:hypothetical protein
MQPVRIAAAALALTALVQPACADMYYDTMGGAGDIQNQLVCPPGLYLKGIRGNAGDWIDRLVIMCAPLESGGRVGDVIKTDRAGGSGGVKSPGGVCVNSIINAVTVSLTEDRRMVAHIEGYCSSPATGPTGKGTEFGRNGWSNAQAFTQQCGLRDAAIGFTIHWGEHVNAVGLVCKEMVIPAAPSLASPAKPIHITGQARAPKPQLAVPTKPPLTVNNGDGGGGSKAITTNGLRSRRAAGGPGEASAATDTTIYDRPEGNDVAYLSAGDAITIQSCDDDNWCQISAPQTGWVWGEDIRK